MICSVENRLVNLIKFFMISLNKINMFTWTEQVALIILEKLNDPELVIYFMNILKPMRLSNLSEEARELILNNDYDILITDLNMPNMNGFELIRSLRSKLPRPR